MCALSCASHRTAGIRIAEIEPNPPNDSYCRFKDNHLSILYRCFGHLMVLSIPWAIGELSSGLVGHLATPSSAVETIEGGIG